MNGSVEDTILDMLQAAGEGVSLSPEAVARRLDADGWRRRLPQVRAAAVGLARRGRLVVTRHGKPADPDAFKGVYRLKAPMAPPPTDGDDAA